MRELGGRGSCRASIWDPARQEPRPAGAPPPPACKSRTHPWDILTRATHVSREGRRSPERPLLRLEQDEDRHAGGEAALEAGELDPLPHSCRPRVVDDALVDDELEPRQVERLPARRFLVEEGGRLAAQRF